MAPTETTSVEREIAIAYGRTAEAVVIALLSFVPAAVIVAWAYARRRR